MLRQAHGPVSLRRTASKNKNTIRLRDLARTLQYKRSQFGHRYTITAPNVKELKARLQRATEVDHRTQYPESHVQASSHLAPKPRVVGISTGRVPNVRLWEKSFSNTQHIHVQSLRDWMAPFLRCPRSIDRIGRLKKSLCSMTRCLA